MKLSKSQYAELIKRQMARTPQPKPGMPGGGGLGIGAGPTGPMPGMAPPGGGVPMPTPTQGMGMEPGMPMGPPGMQGGPQDGSGPVGQMLASMSGMPQGANPATEMVPPMGQGPTIGSDPMGERLGELEAGPAGELDDLETKLWLGFYNSMDELQAMGDPAKAYNEVAQVVMQGQSTGDPELDEFVLTTSGNGAPMVPGHGQIDDADTEAWTAFLS